MRPEAALPADVADFLAAQPKGMGYEALAAACRERFGNSAPTADDIRAARYASPRGRTHRVDADPELRAAIRDRAGLVTLDEMLSELATRFSADRLPSRSSLHRFIAADRRRLLNRLGAAGASPTLVDGMGSATTAAIAEMVRDFEAKRGATLAEVWADDAAMMAPKRTPR